MNMYVLRWRWGGGVKSVVACGPVGRCNSSYADLVSPTLVYIWQGVERLLMRGSRLYDS